MSKRQAQLAGRALSDREKTVLQLIADGLSPVSIGKHLFLSPHTVKSHLRSINYKLGAKNRTNAVAIALRNGLII